MKLTVEKTTIKFVYGTSLEHITHPADATYEDIIKLVLDRFDIPSEFADFIQISNATNYIFTKETFEYFLVLFPKPKLSFHIRVDYKSLMESLVTDTRKPLATTSNKRRVHYDEYGYPTVTRQNCFIGVYPGTEEQPSDASNAKRHKSGDTISAKAVKKIPTRRTIRI